MSLIDLMQGDCLERMKELGDGSVDMILTDPPYGTTDCKWDSVIPFDKMWEQLKRIIKPNGVIVLMAAQPFTSVLISSNLKMFKYEWVWVKNLKSNPLLAKKMPMRGHENICVFYSMSSIYNPQKRKRTTERKSGNPQGKKASNIYHKVTNRDNYKNSQGDWINPDSVLTNIKCVHNSSKDRVHPTQKPVELMEYLIKTYSNENEVVLDFTMGSGTTGVACVNTNRNFIGIEQDEKYFEIAKDRISAKSPEPVQLELFT